MKTEDTNEYIPLEERLFNRRNAVALSGAALFTTLAGSGIYQCKKAWKKNTANIAPKQDFFTESEYKHVSVEGLESMSTEDLQRGMPIRVNFVPRRPLDEDLKTYKPVQTEIYSEQAKRDLAPLPVADLKTKSKDGRLEAYFISFHGNYRALEDAKTMFRDHSEKGLEIILGGAIDKIKQISNGIAIVVAGQYFEDSKGIRHYLADDPEQTFIMLN